jgi:hypothetical protein
MPPSVIEQRWMATDGFAGTGMYHFDGDFGNLEFLRFDITNLAYYIRHTGRAAVIGVGGGRDILSAHLFGFHDITGVELNPIFIDMLSRAFRSSVWLICKGHSCSWTKRAVGLLNRRTSSTVSR